MQKNHCCENMDYYINMQCEEHDNVFDCPDNIVVFIEKSNEYGIIIHDGGTSYISIDYCPWCGSKLSDKQG
jgi:hypothetical protein